MEIVESLNRYLAGTDVPKGVRSRMIKARDTIVALQKDAERYRTFINLPKIRVLGKDGVSVDIQVAPEQWNALLDAAIAAEKEMK